MGALGPDGLPLDGLAPILDEVGPLAERFAGAGHRLYLVGGIVRDLLGRRPLHGHDLDLDLTTDATPPATRGLLEGWADAIWTQGERFGTIGARHHGRLFEITTHRGEVYRPDSRKPTVEFSTEIGADLGRRDFTVNAMAVEVTGSVPALIDPFGGAGDLARGRLRTPRSPEISFDDDPLRMLRAARFVAGYELDPEPVLEAAVSAMAGRLAIVSAERIRDELEKLLTLPDPSRGLRFVHDHGLAAVFLPELGALAGTTDVDLARPDLLDHTVAAVAATPARLRLRLAALFHDVGKAAGADGGPGERPGDHHAEGARLAHRRLSALRFPRAVIDEASALVGMQPLLQVGESGPSDGPGWTDGAVRRLVRRVGPLLGDLVALARIEAAARVDGGRSTPAGLDALDARLTELSQAEDLDAIVPELDGGEVMARLGIGPGPEVGRALAFLLDARIEDGPVGHDEAAKRLDRWWSERQGDAAAG